MSPQEKMDSAFDNYLELSKILQEDINTILDSEVSSQYSRRNFLRTSSALIEGYTHCFRDMCAVSFECSAPEISEKEAKALKLEKEFSAADRIKFTLRAAHKIFEVEPAPDFTKGEWENVRKVFEKRGSLMHPKTRSDLEISDNLWEEIYKGVTWIFEQLFNFILLLVKTHQKQPV